MFDHTWYRQCAVCDFIIGRSPRGTVARHADIRPNAPTVRGPKGGYRMTPCPNIGAPWAGDGHLTGTHMAETTSIQDLVDEAQWAREKGELERAGLLMDIAKKAVAPLPLIFFLNNIPALRRSFNAPDLGGDAAL